MNGQKIVYHSLKMSPEWQEFLDGQLRRCQPGEINTLAQQPPVAVNVELVLEESLSELAKAHLRSASLTDARDSATAVVIPIIQNKEEWLEKNKHTPVYHGEGFSCSRVALRQRFPLMTAFAITVHKAENATMERS